MLVVLYKRIPLPVFSHGHGPAAKFVDRIICFVRLSLEDAGKRIVCFLNLPDYN